MKIAVVTGASSGMGRDFAHALCKDKKLSFDEIWLIARRGERLKELAAELPVAAKILPLDLTKNESLEEYQALLSAERAEVAVLVNAGGFGKFVRSDKLPLQDQLDMVELNVKALTAMCALSLPHMQAGAAIINLGSLSSFQPTPYMNVYAASKAYVLSYSRALNVELKARGIRVIAVCPGWVATEFFETAEKQDKSAVINKTPLWKSADVVHLALKDLHRGRDVSILGAGVRSQVRLVKLLPHSLVMKIWLKQQGHK
ncbi:MAG: SDR family NAD(P)-dependent oxidoreductase [Oscillospiraceae bacterium]|nr:SDR family NAD(P)-dependent oxidoreductase [Oscillospiraceae bacterium]